MAMSDEDIVKALENCTSHSPCCPLCKYDAEYDISSECMGALMIDALDLLKRKDAEIERLRQKIKEIDEHFCEGEIGKGMAIVINLVKEMVGD